MAADYPPFMNATGTAKKILARIKEAGTPERFTQDFLATTLGFPGGTPKPIISILKRIGFLGQDGVPTELYSRFRNPQQSGAAMAEGIRRGYAALFKLNEGVHKLDKKALAGVVMQLTGLTQGHSTVDAIVGTFEALKSFADFEAPSSAAPAPPAQQPTQALAAAAAAAADPERVAPSAFGMNLAYTINLNLPETTNIAVFNAIFQRLRDNLLKR